ncbi:MAG: ABC transporter substrate-binding protein [Bifidobacteriaceae bacterium]|nr:ABC transporter substrate-binding protein [Bifidobacteriaceae bacterium]
MLRSTFVPLAVLALILAGCGQNTPSDSDTSATTEQSAEDSARGGTLRVVGTDDIDHLDPTMVGLVVTNNLTRTVSRQLVSYGASNDQSENVQPKADLAVDLPEVSDDGLTYTFTLRDNAMWDAPDGARAITSSDVANGIERICNPVGPSFTSSYFSVIAGFDDYCAGYDTDNPSATDVRDHILNDSITGIATPDDTTVVFTLNERASDFIFMLSLANASPVPVEALEYEPDSPDYRSNYISSGPYTVDEYVPDNHLFLKRNEAWVAESDPLRAANVDRIEITFGVTPDNAIQQIRSDDADVTMGISPTAAQIAQFQGADKDRVLTFPPGSTFFLWINSISDNNDGALQDVEVRKALQYAVNKASLVQQLGGTDLGEPAIGIFGSGVVGYSSNDLYPTDGSAGDPAKTRELLDAAGIGQLPLKLAYRADNAVEPSMAQIIQENLAQAGVDVELVPIPGSDFYPNFMMQHENGAEGAWDLALCGWSPDWAGGAARSVFQPQFTYDGLTEQGYNYVDYDSATANDLAAQALSAATIEESAELWAQVSDSVMADAPVLPLYTKTVALFYGPSVGNFQVFALSEAGDWTNLTVV